jgi:geranylgeranyl diphosphate synthase type II
MSLPANPAETFEKHLAGFSLPGAPSNLYEPIRYTLELGGKRVRPQLTLIAAGIFSGKMDAGLHAAMAVELLHNFTLIHDDIMDNAGLRRGKPTVFKKWGLSDAILSGDVLFNIAWRQLLNYHAGLDTQRFGAVIAEFDRAVTVVCEGQAKDLALAASEEVQADQYIDMIYAKTASLLEASLVLGAIAGGADHEIQQTIGEAGKLAGIAFQIQDDLLDALPQSESFGKVRGGDIREGKKTLLWIRLMERKDPSDRNTWHEILRKASSDESAVARILEAFEQEGVYNTVKAEADAYYALAMEKLSRLPQNEFTAYLSGLFKQLLNRNA